MSYFIFRSLPLSADSRTTRNASIYNASPNQVFTWELDGVSTKKSQSFPFSRTTKFKKIFFILYMFWVPLKILFKAKREDTIVFMDLETIIFGYFIAKLKNTKIYFDIVDPSSQTKTNNPNFSKILDKIEYFFAKKSHRVITPHACRIAFYKDRIEHFTPITSNIVIENVPLYETQPNQTITATNSRRNDKFVIGYFGTLDADTRGLEWLIELASQPRSKVKLIVAGQGALSLKIEAISANNDNIKFLGAFTHASLPELYDKVDVTWAYYSPNKVLHKYAAPNKFYEHIYFRKPIIISSIIPHAKEIASLKTGISLDAENFSAENFEISTVRIEEIINSAPFNNEPAKNYWNSTYANYYKNVSARALEA